MSMMGGSGSSASTAVGETVATFTEYEGAQKAVSKLIASDIPARDIAIVGSGLRSIERVTGRLGYATAARSGAINGILIGLLFSAILVLGSPEVPIQAFVGVIFVGIAVGMLLSIILYSFIRRRRDYASVMQVASDHYEVTVAAKSIQRAREVLGHRGVSDPPAAPATPAPVVPPADAPVLPPAGPAPVPGTAGPEPSEPPRYGERVPPPPPSGGAETDPPR